MTIVEAAAYTSTCLPLDGGAPGLDECAIGLLSGRDSMQCRHAQGTLSLIALWRWSRSQRRKPVHLELITSQHTIESDDTLLRPRRWRDSISESWLLELCLAASSRIVMDVTSRLDAARHGLRLGASEASRNAAVYQWAERSV
jgi:hypothetical protein